MGHLEERERAVSELIEELNLDRGPLARGLTAGTGTDYLRWLGGYLSSALGVDYVLIGELWGEDWQQVRTQVVRTPTETLDNFEYDLADTPCAEVVGQSPCCFPRDVDLLFPNDELLVQMGVKSYVGVPLIDTAGRPLGLIALLESKPMDDTRVERLMSVLGLFRERTEAVLTAQRMRREYNALLSAATYSPDESAFESLLRSLAHALHMRTAWIAQYTDATHSRLRVTSVSSAGCDVEPFEYDVAGTPGEHLAHGSTAVHAAGVCERFPRAKHLLDFEAQAAISVALTGSDGTELGQLVLLHNRPIAQRLSGQPLLKAFARRMVTELERRNAEELRRSIDEKLQAKQRIESLGMLAGGVAHDFNNLLSSILGNAELLRDGEDPGIEPAVQLAEIERAAEAASELCRQLLDYAGQRAMTPRHLRLNDLVQEMVRLQAASLSSAIRIEVELSEPSPIIEADPGRIRQVVLNLIRNGCDAIGDQPGTLCVRTLDRTLAEGDFEQAELSEWLEPGHYAALEVQDSGCGMDRATVKRMFDPFFTTKEHGRGLGLAAVLGILKSHHATVQVASEPQQGTTIVVYLPAIAAADARLAPLAPAEAPPVEDATGVVLVTDDEPSVRAVARRMLATAGLEPVEAASGVEALEIVRYDPERFDCIVADLSMPGLDGIETLHAVRALSPAIGTVLMTGHALPDIAERIRESEFDATLAKPFRRADLLAQVGAAIARHAAGR
jgi:signal transduction histidine kinase/ActR/RegA family two-component response regulator